MRRDRGSGKTGHSGRGSAKSLPGVDRPYDSPRITRALGGRISRKRVVRLVRQEQLHARQRSKYRVATTDSLHGDPIAANRLRGLVAKRPDQVYITNATCVMTGQGWLYVIAVLDVYTRRIVGLAMHDILEAKLAVAGPANGFCPT